MLAAPQDEEHDQMHTWVGGDFDPESFDPNAVSRIFRYGRWRNAHPAQGRRRRDRWWTSGGRPLPCVNVTGDVGAGGRRPPGALASTSPIHCWFTSALTSSGRRCVADRLADTSGNPGEHRS